MEVVYSDGCPTLIRDQYADGCGNLPKLCYSRTDDCLTITHCGTNLSAISSILIEYSTGDPITSPNWKVYSSCIDLTLILGSRIFIRMTVYYVGGCKPITLNDIYPIDVKTIDCHIQTKCPFNFHRSHSTGLIGELTIGLGGQSIV